MCASCGVVQADEVNHPSKVVLGDELAQGNEVNLYPWGELFIQLKLF